VPPTLLQPLGKSSRGGSNKNASELERDIQLAFEKQEKSLSALAPIPGSLYPCYPSAELLYPYTKQEYNRGRTSCGRLEELGHGSLYCSQDRGEEAQE
jgi:hypothetical protein